MFLHLRREIKEIYYFKEKQEVDFYANIEGKKFLINVSFKIENEKTKQRELGGLLEAMEYFGLNESYLITEDVDELVEVKDKKIVILPLYKYLLEM